MQRERLEDQGLVAQRDRPTHVASALRKLAQGGALAFDREQTTRTLGFCGWVVAGGVALFAIWELGNFETLLGNEPSRPAIHEPAAPGTYRPAGETSTGCTQAPIDRSGGHTTPADCHT